MDSNTKTVTGKFSISLTTLGFITFIVFLILKLCNPAFDAAVSWFWVWFPFWIPWAIDAAIIVIALIIAIIAAVL